MPATPRAESLESAAADPAAAGRALYERLVAEARGFVKDYTARRIETGRVGKPIPSTVDVVASPEFWRSDPGRAIAKAELCEHKVLKTSTCPLCVCQEHCKTA